MPFPVFAIWLAWLLCLASSAQAYSPAQYDSQPFGQGAMQLQDPSLELTLAQVRQSSDWQPTGADHPNFGYTDAAVWFRQTLELPPTQWWLWIRYALLDEVDLYICPKAAPTTHTTEPQPCQHQQSGDSLPFNQRAIQHPDLILPINATGEVELYIRLRSQGTSQLPAWLISEAELDSSLLSYNLLRGGFMCALLVMGLYNLFIALTTGDRNYLLYSGFVLSFLLLHMTYEGSAFQFLWPQWPEVNRYALPMLFGVNQLILCLFVTRFLRLAEHSPTMHGVFTIFAALAALSIPMALVSSYGSVLFAQNLLSTVITVSALTMGIRIWRRGEVAARYFCIAWVVFIIGMVFTNVRSLGWLPTNTLTLFSYQIGSFLEIILLSMALGERITRLQRNELKARQQRLQSQEQAILYLRSFEDLYHNSLTGQFQLDVQGRFTKSNPSWRTMINLAHCDTERLPNFDRLFADDSVTDLWQILQQHGQVQRYLLTCGDGSERRWLSITMRRRRGEELAGSDTAWIGSAQDVTQQTQHEQRLQHAQAEKAQSLRQMVMGIAHEMNTPLGNIQMAQSYLHENIAAVRDDELRQQLCDGSQHIDQGIARLKDLNQVMKNSALIEEQQWQELIHLRQWFRHWQQETLRLDPELQLTVKISSFTQQWFGDSDALGRVLNQLVDNSLRHNRDQALNIHISVYDKGDELRIRYQDNGCGIAKEDRERIFLPFYTTRRSDAGSCGLGLYEVHNLVQEILAGKLQWGSAEGFDLTLVLPLAEADQPQQTRLRPDCLA
ncbi:hypothetical protein CHH28_15865 [Bacterioplanes sanyensis]|uniref:histidine kinase n=1 Tax=Bacterioplanes sanyensis TaxID=1249553 RepID=A0A222FMT3_9GAMM|nr:sensor histidine kinase [Bacterioplanes sanyensis]ASP40059.1 hypothetical protein CHH28_15865 [Bacterioplanes sanyensis]